MTIVIRKNAAFIGEGVDPGTFNPPMYDPPPNFNDKTSGMQLATVNGIIGSAPAGAALNFAGQTIGAAAEEAAYHSSVAINV